MAVSDELLWLVRHRVRRRILLAVGEAGKISATALKEKLGISTGSLYYNLRQLSPLITQDQKRNYMLTEQGELVYKIVTQQSNQLSAPPQQSRITSFLSNLFFPIWLFAPIYEYTAVASIVAPLSLAVLLFLFINARFELILLHAIKPERFVLTDFGLKMGLSLVISLIYLISISSILAGSTSIKKIRQNLRQSVGDVARFFACMMAAFLPMGILPGVASVDRVFRLGIFSGDLSFVVRDILLVLSQTITVLLLAAAVSYYKKLRWQGALAVAFSYFYLSYGVSYFI